MPIHLRLFLALLGLCFLVSCSSSHAEYACIDYQVAVDEAALPAGVEIARQYDV